MGYNILTPYQSQVVDALQEYDEITRWYFFTGGTALSEVYLQHRYSEDLDFFTTSPVNDKKIRECLDDAKKTIGYDRYERTVYSGLFRYTLIFPDGTKLKIDFNEYDFPQIERGPKLGKFAVDSLYDIAINKLDTILSRTKARDFVDLYCSMPAIGCNLEQVLMRLRDKFSVEQSDAEIMRHLATVVDATDYPTMLIPFDRQKMVEFYLKEAKKFGEKIFK